MPRVNTSEEVETPIRLSDIGVSLEGLRQMTTTTLNSRDADDGGKADADANDG